MRQKINAKLVLVTQVLCQAVVIESPLALRWRIESDKITRPTQDGSVEKSESCKQPCKSLVTVLQGSRKNSCHSSENLITAMPAPRHLNRFREHSLRPLRRTSHTTPRNTPTPGTHSACLPLHTNIAMPEASLIPNVPLIGQGDQIMQLL